MRDVFVSYSSRDRERAKVLEAALESCGVSVWWDRELEVGESYDVKIERELKDSKAVVVLWSEASVRSNWVKAEAQEAMGRGCLLPAILDSGVKPPLEFRFLNAVDLSEWDDTLEHPEFDRLLRAIRSKIAAVEERGEKVDDPSLTTTMKERLLELLDGSALEEGPAPSDSGIRRLSAATKALARRIARRQDDDSPGETPSRGPSQRPAVARGATPPAAERDPLAGVDPLPTIARYLAWSFALPGALLVAFQVAHRLLP